MRKGHVIALAASYLLLWGGIASASTINTTYIDGIPWDVTNVSTFDTTGNTMDGLSVTVTFDGGTTATASWVDGLGAVGVGWALTYSNVHWGYDGSTYSSYSSWNLSNISGLLISDMVIDGHASDVVFDTIYPAYVTPSSAEGWSIESMDSTTLSVRAVYSNVVSVNGTTYSDGSGNHDLYSTLTLTFAGGYSGTTFAFNADTDNVNAVPEPCTMLLLGTGLAGLAGISARKKSRLI